jgi:glutathione S-transferase
VADFIVHGLRFSPYVRTVLLALEEKGAAYEVQPVAFGSAEHLDRHPFARIPALEHGDFHLFETQAILRYLDRILPEPALTPADPKGAARMDQLMGINDWYLFGEASKVIGFQRIMRPKLMGRPSDEAACAAAEPFAVRCMAALSGMLGGQMFMAGEALTLADLMIAPQFEFLVPTPEGERALAPHANLRRWFDRMRDRPSMRATAPNRPPQAA